MDWKYKTKISLTTVRAKLANETFPWVPKYKQVGWTTMSHKPHTILVSYREKKPSFDKPEGKKKRTLEFPSVHWGCSITLDHQLNLGGILANSICEGLQEVHGKDEALWTLKIHQPTSLPRRNCWNYNTICPRKRYRRSEKGQYPNQRWGDDSQEKRVYIVLHIF